MPSKVSHNARRIYADCLETAAPNEDGVMFTRKEKADLVMKAIQVDVLERILQKMPELKHPLNDTSGLSDEEVMRRS